MDNQQVITEFFARLADPSDPNRNFVWHLNLVEIVTLNDGTNKIGAERQLNMEQAIAGGYALPEVLAELNASVAAEVIAVRAEKAKADEEIETLKAEKAEAEKTVGQLMKVAQELLLQRDAAVQEVSDMASARPAASLS